MKPIILRTDAELAICEQYMDRLSEVAEVVTTDRYDEPGLIAAAKDAALILTCYSEISGPVIEAAAGLKGIVKYGVGVDAIDIAAATERGVIVANCPAYGSDTVADHAFALLIALARRLPELDRIMRADGWAWPEPGLLGRDLAGKTIGLVGLGRIGTAMARRCQGFAMRILVSDPYVTEAPDGLDVAFTDLETMLAESDFVSIHCVLTDETRGLIGTEELGLMKRGALLIDVSRGAIVDEAALVRALDQERIGGAGFDVFPGEPLTPAHPLQGRDNVLLTPHLAWYTAEALQRVEEQTLQSILDILAGRVPKNLKNSAVLEVLGPDIGRRPDDLPLIAAHAAGRGHAVRRPDADALFIKVERQGKEYVHHYLVQVAPAPGQGMSLIYIDPDEPLLDFGAMCAFDPGTAAASAITPEPGHIFATPKGMFLMVHEDPMSQKMFAFIDVTSGEVLRRQDRKVDAVHVEWLALPPRRA